MPCEAHGVLGLCACLGRLRTRYAEPGMILITGVKLQGSGEMFLSPLRGGLSGGPPSAPSNAGLSEGSRETTLCQQSSQSEGTLWSLDTIDGRQQARARGAAVSEHSRSGPTSTRSNHPPGNYADLQYDHAQRQRQHHGQHVQQQQRRESMWSPHCRPHNPSVQVLSFDSGSWGAVTLDLIMRRPSTSP